MNKYRAFVSFSYEFESEKDFAETLNEATQLIENIVGQPVKIRLEKIPVKIHKIRLGEFTPTEVLDFISKENRKKDYVIGEQVYTVKMDSDRYFVFKESLKCVACGLEITKVFLEKSLTDNTPHFNFYGVENGNLILQTKDHKLALCKGGKNKIENYFTCCTICNNLKGSDELTYDQVGQLRKCYNENRNLPKKKLREAIFQMKQKFISSPLNSLASIDNNICCKVS